MSTRQEPATRGSQLFADLFRHLITISLAGIGFLFTARNLDQADGPFSFYVVSLVWFGVCVVTSLFGHVSLVSAALGEESRFSRFNARWWFGPAWLSFLVGFMLSFVAIVYRGT